MTDRPNIHDIEKMDVAELVTCTFRLAKELGMELEEWIPQLLDVMDQQVARAAVEQLALDYADQLRARDVDRGPWREELAALEEPKR